MSPPEDRASAPEQYPPLDESASAELLISGPPAQVGHTWVIGMALIGHGCVLDNPAYGSGSYASESQSSATASTTAPNSGSGSSSMTGGGSTSGMATTGPTSTGPASSTSAVTTAGSGGSSTEGTTTGGDTLGPEICGIPVASVIFIELRKLGFDGGGLGDPVLLSDGKTLVVSSAGDFAIATRSGFDEPFSALNGWSALDLLNETWAETKISFSSNELEAYFSSDSDWGDEGDPFSTDIWLAKRDSKAEPFGTPQIVSAVSTAQDDYDPHISDDGLRLYFAPIVKGMSSQDILVATRGSPDVDFSSPQPVAGLNVDSYTDADPAPSRDELVMIFASERDDIFGDLYLATRDNLDAPFGAPIRLDEPVNSDSRELDPFVADTPLGCELYFSSSRGFGTDIYRVEIAKK